MSYANGTQLKSSSTGTAGNGGTTNGTGGAGPPRYPAPPGRPQNYTIYSKDSDRLLWEMRAVNHRTPNTTPASTVLNSPDLTDLDTKMRYQHSTLMQHHQIKVGRSPVGSGGNNDSNNSTNPSSPTQIGGPGGAVLLGGSQGGRQQFSSFSLLSDGEMVVFDDIESVGGWRMSSGRDILGSSPVPSENDDSGADGVVGADRDDDDEKKYYDVDSTKKQRIIGGLTIAEYEGSPRRFGTIDRNEANPHGAAAGGRIPKPGFPKRVISPSPSETHQRLPYEPHSELINLNDDDDDNNDNLANDGNRDEVTGSRNAPSDSKFNRSYADYFASNEDLDEGDRSNPTPTNLLTSGEDAVGPGDDNTCGGDGAVDDYFYAYATTTTNNNNRNAQSNAYVGQRLATKQLRNSGNIREWEADCSSSPNRDDDDCQDDQNISDHLSNNYPYYQKYNTHYRYGVATVPQQQSEIHNQQRFYQSHQAHYQGYGTVSGGGVGGREAQDIELYIESDSGGFDSGLDQPSLHQQQQQQQQQHQHSLDDCKLRSFTLSPETTDYDSNCGDLDSEVSLRYIGLSGDLNGLPGHVGSGVTGDPGTDYGRLYSSMPILEDGLSSGHASDTENNLPPPGSGISIVMDQQSVIAGVESEQERTADVDQCEQQELDSCDEVQEAIKDIKAALQKTKILPSTEGSSTLVPDQEGTSTISPVWVPRAYSKSRESLDSDQPAKLLSADEEEADTDLETDRLLGQQRLDEHGFVDDKSWTERPKIRSVRSPGVPLISKNHTAIRAGLGTQLSAESPVNNVTLTNLYGNGGSVKVASSDGDELKQLATVIADSSPEHISDPDKKGKCKTKEGLLDPTVLIEGVLFRARYLGSTQLVCEGQPTKSTRMMQAEEAVSRIKAPEGETQPSTEVDLFISTEKIMVLNTDLKEIMMDHALRTISYIADIGDLVVLMARRRFVPQDTSESGDPAAPLTTGQQTTAITADAGGGSSPPPKKSVSRGNRTPKMICHVFESAEAQFIAQSIGQAFQVAYMEFLKANGIEDHSFMKEMDYQEVLNSQEIFGDELEIFAKKELQKEVVVPKAKGEILGVVIVESGWGSMLPTVVIANLSSSGAAARCGQLNIGDQIIAINGLSLVGLPLSTCQGYIKNTKTQTAVKFTVVPCAPVVEVRIKRPNTKYQLGFSVQNGVICSLLRGGIAERGGVRVGHRIIEINSQSVVAVPHEKIVNLLATSVGEIHMKTMPTSMFRLLTGQENPIYI
ncbi:amyloid-beta A4 precursor protein-binding family A member 2-like isoform X2 [Malaya genurostris]|uniref:amyloid-beta A4 precursor protein-binding family A member 2-like isoform X2 n=1 Tax=Malaya genurostris TaxID=325434 RepID=UPI0026F3E5E0|nr:amyloid-beta A4 precursor protein-binding family A member 2-like isoform X2 [Malaya genurostris]